MREGQLRSARSLAAQALEASVGDPYAAGAALLVAQATADPTLVSGVDAAACWERVLRDDDVGAIAFFGGAYASTIGDAFAAREILEAVFSRTPPVASSIEALLAAAECGDRALAANVLERIDTIAADAPPELRGIAAHATALVGRARDDNGATRPAAQKAQRDYARAGWAYYAARAAELAGDVRSAQSAYRRAGAAHDVARLAAAEHPNATDPLSSLARRERDVAALIAAGLANKEIAARLNISVKTVEKNVTAIYSKLGVTRRVQLARRLAPKRDRQTVTTGNLPTPLTSFIGRAEELADLHERARRNRLLSLVGPGGSGKSRLACEIARREAGTYPDGAWFVDLTTIAEASGVWPLLAATLGIPRDPQRALDATVTAWLADRVILLVLDNAEHLLPAFGRAVYALLQAGPGVRIVISSRERAGVFGENVFRVGPMRHTDGTAFFRERAAAAGTPLADERLAGTICDRLDCIPLAIELAAARLYDLSIEALANAVEGHVPVLATDDVGIPPRHHSIDALVEWGYQPLSAAAQRAFRGAAVFNGAFPLAAAEALLGADARTHLERLGHASLIEVLPSGGYRMLQVVRDVALAKLRAHGDDGAAFRNFAAYYDELLAIADDEWFVRPIAAWLEPLKGDSHNILAAIHWALGQERDLERGVRMTANAARIWSELAREPELEPYLTKALRHAETALPRVRVRLWLARSRALDIMRAGAQAVEASRHAFADALEGGDAVDIAMCRLAIGSASATLRDIATAREHLAGALAMFREQRLKRPEASALTALAIIAETDEQRAADFRDVLAIARALDDPLLEAITLSNLSIVSTALGESETARGFSRDAAAIFERLAAPMRLARARIDLARAEFACGNLDGAAEAAGAALHYFASLGAPLLRAECATWIAKALAPNAPERAARFCGYAASMRRSGGDDASDPIDDALRERLGAERFTELALDGSALDASVLLDELSASGAN